MSHGFSTFLNRPIFPAALPINWVEAPARGVLADPRAAQVGFGVAVVEPLQEFTANDFMVTAHLDGAYAINALERFFAFTYGPLRGFWMPGIESVAEITAVQDAQTMTVALGTQVNGDPRWKYLWFVPLPGSSATPRPAVMQSVVATDDGTGSFTLTLTAVLPTLPTPEWAIMRLAYVRLGTNDLKLVFWGDGRARAQLRLVELPYEYTAIELGERPAFLYTFVRAAGETVPAKTWRLTSFDQAIVEGGHTFLPAPITHSKFQRSMDGNRDGLTINSWLDGSDNPLATFVLVPPQLQMRVAVDEVRLDAVAGEISGVSTAPVRLFAGVVATVVPDGRKLEATCRSRLDSLQAQTPRFMIGKLCNYRLYNAQTCRVDKEAYKITGTVAQIDGQNLTLDITGGDGDRDDHWFAEGWIAVVVGDNEEYRAVADSTRLSDTQQLLSVNARFSAAVAVGAQFVAYPGCDLSPGTCTSKFDNFINFGGHPQLPNDLGLKVINQKAGGGKGGK